MVIAHNILAMNAQRQYGITTGKERQTTEKLTSGYKINRSADDAAGLSISEKFRKQMRGLTRASLNAEEGISMTQIADGAMAEVHDMIDRGVELSVKAANGTLSISDREMIQEEIDHLKTEIDSIKERTKFNEIFVLKGKTVEKTKVVSAGVGNAGNKMPNWVTFGSAEADGHLTETYQSERQFVVDPNAQPQDIKTVQVNHSAASIDFSGFVSAADLIGSGFHTTCCSCDRYYSIEFTTGTSASVEQSGQNYIYKIGIDNITSGADLVTRIIAGTDNGNPNGHYTKLVADNGNPAKLYIYDDRSNAWSDVDTAATAAGWVNGSQWINWPNAMQTAVPSGSYGEFGQGVMRELTVSVSDGYDEIPSQLKLQIGAESQNRMTIALAVISSYALGIDAVDVTTVQGADNAIDAFNAAKEFVSKERSRMGAYQNRLEHTIKNLDNIVENTTAAESRIRDTDMAEEMVKYFNINVLKQAGQSMMAQANQWNQGVLSLIA